MCQFGISEFWEVLVTFMTKANVPVMCESGWGRLAHSYTTEISVARRSTLVFLTHAPC